MIAALLVVLNLSSHSAGQTSTAASAGRSVPNRVERTAAVQWQRVPLQNALSRLRGVFEDPIFIDRRVDPSLRVSLEIQDATLSEVLQALSAAASLGYSELQPVHYLGPPAAAEQLRTIAAVRRTDASRLAAQNRAALELKQTIRWPRLTQPRKLVTTLVERRGWRIDHAERIPHDLWAAGELPAIALTDQLTLLLVGFELTYRIQSAERSLEIVALEKVTIEREYPLPNGSSAAMEPLRQLLGNVKSHRREAAKLIVNARVEQHQQLAALLRARGPQAPANRPTRQTKQVYTLSVQEQPVGAVLNELAARLGWELEVDVEAIRAAGRSLDRRVSFSVENADEDKLLDALLRPAGLDYRRDGDRMRISPRGADGSN